MIDRYVIKVYDNYLDKNNLPVDTLQDAAIYPYAVNSLQDGVAVRVYLTTRKPSAEEVYHVR